MQLGDTFIPNDEAVNSYLPVLKWAGEQQEHLQNVSKSETTKEEPQFDVALKMTVKPKKTKKKAAMTPATGSGGSGAGNQKHNRL